VRHQQVMPATPPGAGARSRLVDRHIVLLRCCILLLYKASELRAQGFEFISLTWVELRGFEPRTSCMPSAGSTSTAVHLCRSPSQAVRISPPGSRPVAVLSCCTGQLGPSRYRWARDQPEPPRTLLRRFPGKQASPPQSPAPRPAHSKAVRGSAQTTGPRRRGITAGAARFQAPDGCIHGGGWRRATLRLSGHGS
jgi:hypothetical protein